MTVIKTRRPAAATYSLNELAGLLGTSYGGTYDAMLRDRLPVKPFRVGRQWRFPKAEVDRLLGLDEDETKAARQSA